MCCYKDKAATKKFIAGLKKSKKTWFWAYKQLDRNGKNLNGYEYQYKVGENVSQTEEITFETYSTDFPKGIHFYLNRDDCDLNLGSYHQQKRESELEDYQPIVKVKVYVEDLICVDGKNYEGVANAVYIEKTDWETAKIQVLPVYGDILKFDEDKDNYLVIQDPENNNNNEYMIMNNNFDWIEGSLKDLIDEWGQYTIVGHTDTLNFGPKKKG